MYHQRAHINIIFQGKVIAQRTCITDFDTKDRELIDYVSSCEPYTFKGEKYQVVSRCPLDFNEEHQLTIRMSENE